MVPNKIPPPYSPKFPAPVRGPVSGPHYPTSGKPADPTRPTGDGAPAAAPIVMPTQGGVPR